MSGCLDGERCDCPDPGQVCVANSATSGSADRNGDLPSPTGGRGPDFFKGNPVPAATVPLSTLVPPDKLLFPAPCHMLYVADVVWPAKSGGGGPVEPSVQVKGTDSTGRLVAPEIGRFGRRQTSTACLANADGDGDAVPNDWYGEEIR